MATTTSRYDSYDGTYDEKALGWVTFASVMLGFAGIFNFMDGIVALAHSKFFIGGATYVFSDLKTWGWIVLLIGIGQIGAAFAVNGGSQLARWFGIGVASVNALAQLMFVQAYPFWALAAFAADVLIVYALAVYGGKKIAA